MGIKKGKIAIVPGSFDPMTLGHRALIEQACEEFETVYVAVMNNAEKKSFLNPSVRCKIAQLTLSDLPNVKIVSDNGLLVDLYDRLGADAVCKGYRNETDLAYEKKQDEWNRAHNPRFFTKLIPARPGTEGISSTAVRERILKGDGLEGIVAKAAIPVLEAEVFKK